MSDREHRRRLAAALRKLNAEVVAASCDDAVFEPMVAPIEALAAELATSPRRRNTTGQTGIADRPERPTYDYGDIFDFSPFSGPANPVSLPLRWDVSDERIRAHARFDAHHEGPPGHVHGGLVAAVFDELFGAAQTLTNRSRPAMTAELTIRLRAPCPIGVDLVLEGRVREQQGRRIVVTVEMHHDDTLIAEGEAIMITMDPARYQEIAG